MQLSKGTFRSLVGLFAVTSILSACSDCDPVDPTRSAHLGLPRLFFSGEIVVNVGTGNNNNVLPVIDDVTASIRPEFRDRFSTREEFRKFMESPTEDNPSAGIVGGWNYYGDMRVSFRDAKVTGFQKHFGEPVSADELGPFEGSNILAPASVMTDLHPSVQAGGVSTRWTFATLAITDETGRPLLSLPVGESSFYWFVGPTVRYFFTLDNEAARAALQDAPSGSVTEAFRQEVEAGAGFAVQVRLSFPNGIPEQEGLAEKFASGDKALNPFTGPASGVITPWYGKFAGEHPSARYLVAEGGPAGGVVTTTGNAAPGTLTLDFGSSGMPSQPADEKNLYLHLTDVAPSSDALATVAPAEYDNVHSEFFVDIEVTKRSEAELASGDLLLTDHSGMVMYRERPRVVTVEPIGLWLDEGESSALSLQVTERGVPLAGATIYVQQYGYDENETDYLRNTVMLDIPSSVTTDEFGRANIQARGVAPGNAMITYELNVPFPDRYSETDGVFDTFVRVLPAYDDTSIPDAELTWEVLYREVLQYYDVIFPGMSTIFDLGDEATMRRGAPLVLSRLVELSPESPYYMPVTRDMPKGKRRLLERWLRLASE